MSENIPPLPELELELFFPEPPPKIERIRELIFLKTSSRSGGCYLSRNEIQWCLRHEKLLIMSDNVIF